MTKILPWKMCVSMNLLSLMFGQKYEQFESVRKDEENGAFFAVLIL